MYVIVLLIVAAVAAGVLIANAVFSSEPRRRRGPLGGGGAPPAAAPVPARPVGPRGSPGYEELPPFEVLEERWDQEAPPHLPYPGERPGSRRSDSWADDQPDPGDDDSGGGDDD